MEKNKNKNPQTADSTRKKNSPVESAIWIVGSTILNW